MEHEFTPIILRILRERFGELADEIYQNSLLLQYLNVKTKAASRDSKSRPSFGNHYALYVLIEDYVTHGYPAGNYGDYAGARFSDLFRRQRDLPFGSKLQNHALNHRLNEEFKRYFPTTANVPILRNTVTSRYWINENLLWIEAAEQKFNIAKAILSIIETYISSRKSTFEQFIESLTQLQNIAHETEAREFIANLLQPQVDARIFEIVSYAILKAFYAEQTIIWGWTEQNLRSEKLSLFKTGRTNANDGGIDFVMKPLGRFFQVTETLDVKKYFLDIDKIHRYPLTFVIKSNDSIEEILTLIRLQAHTLYSDETVVKRYLNSIEEIINTPILLARLDELVQKGQLKVIIEEIIIQSKGEFNYD